MLLQLLRRTIRRAQVLLEVFLLLLLLLVVVKLLSLLMLLLMLTLNVDFYHLSILPVVLVSIVTIPVPVHVCK